jgi:putative transposase
MTAGIFKKDLMLSQAFRSFYFHLVWSTKDRKDFITEDMEERLYSYVGGILKNQKQELMTIGGTSNHVHLLISCNLTDKFTDLIRDLKAGSSQFIHQHYPEKKDFLWQRGYGAFTVSHSSVDKVAQYIQNQKQHHKKYSFEDEFLKLLGKHTRVIVPQLRSLRNPSS